MTSSFPPGILPNQIGVIVARQSDVATALADVVSAASVDQSGNLVITRANSTSLVAGNVIGPSGPTGSTGPAGNPGSTGGVAVIGTPVGTYDATTNTPALSSGSGNPGDSYVVSNPGTASPSIDGITAMALGSVLLRGSTTWGLIPAQAPAVYTVSNIYIPGSSLPLIDVILDSQGRILQGSTTTNVYLASSTGLVVQPGPTDLAATNTNVSTEVSTRTQLITAISTPIYIIGSIPETMTEIVLDLSGRITQSKGVSGINYSSGPTGLEQVITVSSLPDNYLGPIYIPGVGTPVSATIDINNRVTDCVMTNGSRLSSSASGLVSPSSNINNMHFDIVIYGATISGLMAAVRAKAQYGLRVAILEPTAYIGGASASVGLSAVDLPATSGRIGGDTLNVFFNTIASIEGNNAYRYIFQPKSGIQAANQIAAQYTDLTLTNVEINGPGDIITTKGINGTTIIGIVTRAGIITGTQFIDASYEADLGIATLGAGMFTLGRESTSTYGESAAGFHAPTGSGLYAVSDNTQYPVVPDPLLSTGAADGTVQSFGPRGVLTRIANNVIKFPKPPNYDNTKYIVQLQMWADSGYTTFARPVYGGTNLFFQATLANGKIAFNGADLPNNAAIYCKSTWPVRKNVLVPALMNNWYAGLMYCIQNDPIMVTYGLSALQNDSQDCGFCADEFIGSPFGNGCPPWFYLREGYRFTGAQRVLIQADVQGTGSPITTPVCTYNYAFDFHNGQLYAKSGTTTIVASEGFPPLSGNAAVTGMPAEILMSPTGTTGSPNLLMSVCVGMSHIAWGPLRLEPNFGMMGEGAGVIASQAAITGTPVQSYNYLSVAAALTARGSIL